MKFFLILILMFVGLFASEDEYIPFSEFSKDQKIEYNFEKIAPLKKIEVKKEEIRKETVKKVELKEDIKKSKEYIKEIKNNDIIKSKPLIIEKIKENKKKSIVVKPILSNSTNKEINKNYTIKENRKHDFIVTMQLEYSPSNIKYSNNVVSQSDSSDSYEARISLMDKKNIYSLNYFTNSSEFFGKKIDTSFYGLTYGYILENTILGFGVNHLLITNRLNDIKETYPSVGFRSMSNINNIGLVYGASVGKNNDIDHTYEYFFNLDVKPYLSSSSSFVLGYKNKSLKIDDETFTLNGPFIGINTTF